MCVSRVIVYIRRSIIFLRLRVSTLLSCTGVPFTVHFVSVAPFLDRASRCMEFVKMFCKALNSPEKKNLARAAAGGGCTLD